MSWNLNKNRPICPQLCEQICVMISNGELLPEQKLLSVREIAVKAGVNPNTVQKALEQLSSAGIIYSERNIGWYVEKDITNAINTVASLRKEKTSEYLSEMKKLGFEINETIKFLEEWNK